MPAQTIPVEAKDNDIRLDRWFSRYYPQINHHLLQRLIREKDVRVNGKKTMANQHVMTGDLVRVPPLSAPPKTNAPRNISTEDTAFMQSLVLYKNPDMIIINKPFGIAVQGGTKTSRHIDGLLDALRFGMDEKPRLVHRLDKDTSGVLVLARTADAAAKLTRLFSTRDVHKLYWAVVVGKPKPQDGKINAPLLKKSGAGGGEQMAVDFDAGDNAQTLYHTVDALRRKVSWLALMPLSGRTHQLRVHTAEVLHTPILGDAKYGTEAPDLGLPELASKMHLHARAIRIPWKRSVIEVVAPLPPHMVTTFDFLGFDVRSASDPFDFFEEAL